MEKFMIRVVSAPVGRNINFFKKGKSSFDEKIDIEQYR